MKIYTRKGDRGRTSTLSGGTVSKADERIRALGGLDEVNAALGVVLAGPVPAELLAPLAHVQHMLFEDRKSVV